MCELDECLDTWHGCDMDVLLRALPQHTRVPDNIDIPSWEDWYAWSLYNSHDCVTVPDLHHVEDTTAVTHVGVQNIYRMSYRNKPGKQYKSGESL